MVSTRADHAIDGVEALQLLEAAHYDLVLTDVIMPGMSGPRLAADMRTAGYDTPVLFMSGYTDDRLEVHGFDPRSAPLIRKPFTPGQLLKRLAQSLDSGARASN